MPIIASDQTLRGKGAFRLLECGAIVEIDEATG
jgi:hypothetical protein